MKLEKNEAKIETYEEIIAIFELSTRLTNNKTDKFSLGYRKSLEDVIDFLYESRDELIDETYIL